MGWKSFLLMAGQPSNSSETEWPRASIISRCRLRNSPKELSRFWNHDHSPPSFSSLLAGTNSLMKSCFGVHGYSLDTSLHEYPRWRVPVAT